MLHDMLANYIVVGEKQGWFVSRFHFRSRKEGEEFSQLEHGETLSWLNNKGYSRVALDVMYRMVIIGLLSDFCHFIYEGLKTSEKGKLAVSFSLFRKPFKDNLLLFEWLLADPADFLFRFCKEAEHFAPDQIRPDQRIKLIDKARKKLPSAKVFNSKILHGLRYEKNTEYSLEHFWHRATHIVTCSKSHKTENMNLNFVFSQDEDRFDQWEFLYEKVPLLMYYATEVIETLLTSLVKIPSPILLLNQAKRQLGFLFWQQDFYRENAPSEITHLLRELVEKNIAPCKFCSVEITGMENTYNFIHHNVIVCPHCNRTNSFKRSMSLLVHKPQVFSLAKRKLLSNNTV